MGDLIEISITKRMYGWSKYGGANDGLVKEELDEWHCQSCSNVQSKTLPQYMFPLDESEREYARVCTKCKHIGLISGAILFHDLIKYTRKRSYVEKLYTSVDYLMK